MAQPGKQTIALHILTNISRSKGNQAMKFGQLIEYNTRNMFLEKSYKKCGGLFPKSQIRVHLWINSLKFYTICLYCIPS